MNVDRAGAIFWASGLIITGIVLLLLNFDLIGRVEPLAQYIIAACVAAAGIGFFGGYLSNRSMWWRLIPGWTLLSVALMVLLSTSPRVSPMLLPAVLFIGLAIAFANIYLLNRRANWWAIIPGGFLLVLSVVIGSYAITENLERLFAFLLVGLGLVFLLLIVSGPPEVRWWPLLPGLVLVLFGLYILSAGSTTERALLRWWPVLLVVVGLAMGWQSLGRERGSEKLEVNVAPGTAAAIQSVSQPAPSPAQGGTGNLGDYSEPAPGASIEVLSGPDE